MERKAFGKHLVMFWLTALLLCFAGVCTAAADDDTTDEILTVNVTGTYGQTEARSMLEMINEFRTGDDAWYWNEDDTEKVTCSGLKELTYDYKLEEYAMQRAIEIAISFAHIRLDGTDPLRASFWSEYEYSTIGENIAAGQTSAKATFVSWQETDEAYSGQGHRRNMLDSGYTSVGIGHVYYNGTHYWVQEFGDTVASATQTTANDAETTVSVEVAESRITASEVTLSSETLMIPLEEEVALPTVSIKIKMPYGYPSTYRPAILDSVSWTSADSSVASVSENGITGKTAGTTSISATILGTEYTVPVTVQKIDLTGATVTVSDTCTYTRSALEPTPTVTLNGVAVSSSCYTVAYTDNINAGTATVTVTGIGNCTGTASGTFTINARDIYDTKLSVIEDQVYTGSVIRPALTATYAGETLVEGTDYTVKYISCKNVGSSARVYFWGKGNFTNFTYQTFTITPASMDSCSVAEIADQTYTGDALEPDLTVTYGSETLTAGTDYTVVYSNNKEPGTATATLTGTGNYTGTKEVSFTIDPFDISGCTVDAIADQTYTGEALMPEVTVKNGSVTLTAGTDYTVSYEDNTNAGTATVTVTGIGNFTGSVTVNFTIQPITTTTTTESTTTTTTESTTTTTTESTTTTTESTTTTTESTTTTTTESTTTTTESTSITEAETESTTAQAAESTTESSTATEAESESTTVQAAESTAESSTTTEAESESTTVQAAESTAESSTTAAEAETESTTTTEAESESTTAQAAESTTESSTTPTTEAGASPTTAPTPTVTPAPTATPTPVPTVTETPSGEKDSEDDTEEEETAAKRVVPEGGTTLTDKATGAVCRVTQDSADADPVAVYLKPQSAKTASVVIPDTVTVNGTTCKVTAIANNAFKNNRALKKVKIGKYVQTIGKNAFYGCTKLTSVTGGAALTKIGDSAFQKCTALKKITIPAKVKSIGKKAFYGCKKLRTITIKTKLLTAKTVGAKAFSGTYKKATVKVPSSKLKSYKKVLRAKGLSKSAKIKK